MANKKPITPEILTDIDRVLAGKCTNTIPSGKSCQTPLAPLVVDERKLLAAALEEPYEGEDIRKMGLSKMAAAAKSVASQAAEGVPWAVEFLFNRLYGRPKQTIQATNLNMTLKDYLSQLAQDPNTPPDLNANASPSHAEAELVT